MRFLWQSNAPWAGTGYGSQTRLILRELLKLDHEPTCFCFYGLNGGPIKYEGYECLPGSNYDDWGNDVIQIHSRRVQAQCIVTLMDLFVLSPEIWGKLDAPWVAWVPIDSVGIGAETLKRLELCDYPIAMSSFGALQMQNAGIEVKDVIYHAVDTDVFAPGDKAESRDLLGLPQDAWVVGMVMANKGDRKQYPVQLQAVKVFQDKNPDIDVRVYIHTEPTAVMGGWDIRELVKQIGLEGKVYSTNQYDASVIPAKPSLMAQIYNAFDVLMNCSSGEGFGIPIIEAQACGVPVLTTGVTAMPEITWNGYTVEPAAHGLAGHYGWQFYPDVEDMVYRLESVYRMHDKTRAIAGRASVVQHCGLPVITQQWHDLLRRVEEDEDKKRSGSRMVIS